MLQTLLSGICVQAFGASVSMQSVIQPFCGIGKGSPLSYGHIHQDSVVGNMYRYQFRGFHTATGLPQPKNTYPQDV